MTQPYVKPSTAYHGQPYAYEVLVTDTVAYDVVGATAKTVKVRPRPVDEAQEAVKESPGDTSPYPVILHPTKSDESYPVKTLRLRKDGTYRTGPGMNPLRFVAYPPSRRVDYKM